MFDRSRRNSLSDSEFRAALETLDLTYSEAEFEEIFGYLSGVDEEGNGRVEFERYIRFLVAVFEDQTGPSQLQDSFMTVSNGKPFVTRSDFIAAGLNHEQSEALAFSMPKYGNSDDKLDYNKFVESLM
ncbi:Alpha-actinin-2 [Smittium mucronatum]|uniref:Alpha-actinin-2 n=1 Tax=Smittium mucronatum TaxID=133383 RepID=A0A1R0H4X1_9FUNG|nr:Alpha-actinin-2 [Smittium mucronatum]